MKKHLAVIARLLAVVAMISAAAWAAGSAPGQASLGNKNGACLACHKPSALEGSVHGKLACSECHLIRAGGGTKDVPHAPKKDIPLVDCTAKCHREDKRKQPGQSPSFYADSVHGQGYLERGE